MQSAMSKLVLFVPALDARSGAVGTRPRIGRTVSNIGTRVGCWTEWATKDYGRGCEYLFAPLLGKIKGIMRRLVKSVVH